MLIVIFGILLPFGSKIRRV